MAISGAGVIGSPNLTKRAGHPPLAPRRIVCPQPADAFMHSCRTVAREITIPLSSLGAMGEPRHGAATGLPLFLANDRRGDEFSESNFHVSDSHITRRGQQPMFSGDTDLSTAGA